VVAVVEETVSDRYREGYVKGYQLGRIVGVEEVVGWVLHNPLWWDEGKSELDSLRLIHSLLSSTFSHWRNETPEAQFGCPEEPAPPPPESPPLTADEALNLVYQYLEPRLAKDAYITTLRHGAPQVRYSGYTGSRTWRVGTSLGDWFLNERTRDIEPADDGARNVIELYFKK